MIRYIKLLIIFFIPVLPLYGYVPYKQVEVTFDTKVKTYLSTMKDKVVMLEGGNHLIYVLNRYAIVSLHKVEKLAHEIENIQVCQTEISVDQIRTTALLQLMIPIIDKFKNDIMHLITTLEISKKYWELQREQQPFLKIYVKQLMGKTNKQLNDKIAILDAELDRQFTDLGLLTLQLDAFDENQGPDDHLAWMQQLCTIIINAYPHSTLKPNQASFKQIVAMVVLTSKCVTHYPVAIQKQIKPYLMPNNFNKYLLRWATALAGLSTIALYSYDERDMLKAHGKQASASVKTFGLEQYGRIKEAFLGNPEEEKELQAKYKEVLTQLNNELPKQPKKEKRTENKEEKNKKDNNNAKEEKLDPLVLQKNQFDESDIEANAKTINQKYLDDKVIPVVFNVLNGQVEEAATVTQKFSEDLKKLDTGIAKNLGFQDLSDTFWNWMSSEKDKASNSPKAEKNPKDKVINDVINATGEPLHKGAEVAKTIFKFPNLAWLWWQIKLYNVQKQYRLLLAILTSIPIYLVVSESGKGLYALYKKIRGVPVYDAIREALVDIAILLNIYGDAHPSAMAVDDYGRLIYLIGRLKDPIIMKNVPHENRTSFASNVQFLESSILTAAEKRNMIDLMYKRYQFLVNDPRALAKAA